MAKLIFQTLTQEFEDDNIFNFDKAPEDFLQNISEECCDLRHNFPSIDDFSQMQKPKENDFRKNSFEEEKSVVCNTIIGLNAGANNTTDFTLKTPKSVFESKEIDSTDNHDRLEQDQEQANYSQRRQRRVQSASIRWSKDDDRAMFDTLCRLTQQQNIPLQDALQKKQISEEFRNVLDQVKALHNWRGSIYVLKKRVKYIISKPNLSAREERELKRLIRQEVLGLISFNEILTHFPGKSEEYIQNFKSDYIRIMRVYQH